ncbi:hypothetical protein DY000_02000276 [Brassica cretica]|uniref:F-box associated domain-containing protein n=1 Tax=Brassica cretica TaxID=69181 RepID=A0ABQ7C6R0_BRACR|nr:hypothetical protein DY000_02000276 [Brassica cretica]
MEIIRLFIQVSSVFFELGSTSKSLLLSEVSSLEGKSREARSCILKGWICREDGQCVWAKIAEETSQYNRESS